MSTRKFDKVLGAIYGFAIGDAMGATTEFMTEREIRKKYGKVADIIGGGWLRIKPGSVTDDTQMTMCVVRALMKTLGVAKASEHKEFATACSEEFVRWLKSGPIDVGGQCFKSICALANGHPIIEEPNALGNGSLMRALPCALIGRDDLNELQGRLTHNNDQCTRIILEYSRLIQNLVNGNHTFENKSLLEPSGFIVNTFNNALHWASQDSFEEAIIGAVNHGGDADTIAAIAGSIAGARFGFDNIPYRWVDQLRLPVQAELQYFANFICSTIKEE